MPEDRRGAEERMILRESVRINAPPERVWEYLEDPERMKLWNPKIKDVVPVSWGQRSTGFRFFLRLLVSFLHRFGKPTGKKYLIRLKELAESAA